MLKTTSADSQRPAGIGSPESFLQACLMNRRKLIIHSPQVLVKVIRSFHWQGHFFVAQKTERGMHGKIQKASKAETEARRTHQDF